MRRPLAALGSIVFFAAAPGVVAGVLPWAITGWRQPGFQEWGALQASGAVLTAAGVLFLAAAFVRFVLEGRGTPAPVAPTERLVVGGAYRHVRNPMYLAVLSAIGGQAAMFRSETLLLYGIGIAICFAAFVKLYEEPTLLHRYGAAYEAYRRAVPAWLPRLTPARLPPNGA